MAVAAADYERLREQYRPQRLRVLLIAESPPDPGSGHLRFFYAPRLAIDNLYRSVALAIYGESVRPLLADKPRVLRRLTADGFWLIDAVDTPVNKLRPSERAVAIRKSLPDLLERCRVLAPERGVITCKKNIYDEVAPTLRAAGVAVLNTRPLPFPLGNTREDFVRGFHEALGLSKTGTRW